MHCSKKTTKRIKLTGCRNDHRAEVMSVYSLSWKSSSPVRTLISWLPCFPPKTSLPAVLHRPRPSTPVMLQQTTWPGHLISVSHTCQTSVSRCVKDEHTCSLTLTGFHVWNISFIWTLQTLPAAAVQPRPRADHAPVQTRPCKPRPHIDHDAWCHYNSRQ